MFRNLAGPGFVHGTMLWITLLALAVTFPAKEVSLGEALLKDRYRAQPGPEWQAQREWLKVFQQQFAPDEPLRYELRETPRREAECLPGGVIVVPVHLLRQPLAEVVESIAQATAHSLLRHGFRGERIWRPEFSREELAAAEAFVKAQRAGKDFPPLPAAPPPALPGKPAPTLNKSVSPR